MVASAELNSFISKFYQLWDARYSAHLDIGTHAGQAWVGLRGKLESTYYRQEMFHPPPPPNARKKCGPSRLRRRNRRAAARAAMNNKVSDMPNIPTEKIFPLKK